MSALHGELSIIISYDGLLPPPPPPGQRLLSNVKCHINFNVQKQDV